jgi:hypothetical protein
LCPEYSGIVAIYIEILSATRFHFEDKKSSHKKWYMQLFQADMIVFFDEGIF